MFCKKSVPTNLKKFSRQHLCRSQGFGIGMFLWILRICERVLALNEATKKYFHIDIFTENTGEYNCRYEDLEFYLKGTQSQILFCKVDEVLQSFSFKEHYLLLGNCFRFPTAFVTYRLFYQQYINSVTTSCPGTPHASDPHY